MFAFLYFLLIRPQRAQQRKHAEILAALKPGDEVLTAGGIYGV
jgi:preprotein translocase subunit YajC